MIVFIGLGALVLAYLIGSLPLGKLLIEAWTGQRAKDLSAHNLGVENVLRLVGTPVAGLSFFLDVLKGCAALALTAGNPWAALGVYAGHLYPLPLLTSGEVPRGRGNGVLLGVLAGLWAYGGWPFWLVGAPVVLYAALLAWTDYVALATLGGLLALPLLLLLMAQPELAVIIAALLFALALWRHKASLMRIVDASEAKFGDPPPVRGVDPQIVYAAFMVHPLTLDDLWQPRSQRWLGKLVKGGLVPVALVRWLGRKMRPQKQGEIKGIHLADGRELWVMIISGPLLPDQIHAFPEEATRMAIQGARLARELGAEAFGLGAFWSTVGNKGLEVQEAVPDIHITNGGAYTAGTVKAAVPGLLARFEAEGGSLKAATAAVVGANGVVAFGVARMIAAEVSKVILIGRDAERLERSAATLARKYPLTSFKISLNMADCAEADLIFTATSDPDPVIYAEHVKPGAWLFDIGRPADVADSVREVPGVRVIPGGVVKPPGAIQTLIDVHFGTGLVPACMAETMIMTATKAFDRKSLGPLTKMADIDFYLSEGERLGFDIITRDPAEASSETALVLEDVA